MDAVYSHNSENCYILLFDVKLRNLQMKYGMVLMTIEYTYLNYFLLSFVATLDEKQCMDMSNFIVEFILS